MKHSMFILFILLIGGIGVQTTFADSSTVERHFDFSVKVANVDSAFKDIMDFAEQNGGYFTNFNDSYLSLRLPVMALEEFNARLASLVQISEKSFQNADKSADLERLNSQIQSRKKLMESYIGLIKNAPFAELQSVEREMVSLNAQIEHLQGQKLAIERRAALALITIRANNPSPFLRPKDIDRSPFTWINSTNLNSLQGDF